jgi:hypothetical protein
MAGGSGAGEPPEAPKDAAVAFDWPKRYASLKLEMVASHNKLEKEVTILKKDVACLQGNVDLMSIATLVVTVATVSPILFCQQYYKLVNVTCSKVLYLLVKTYCMND